MNDDLNRAIRTTFLGTAGGTLRLETAVLEQESAGYVLAFTGFHADGAPFVVRCAPFTGCPIDRAAQLAADIIKTHTGVSSMSATVTGLAATLRQRLTEVTARAGQITAKAHSSVDNLSSVLDGAEQTITDLDKAAADVQAALGMNTNGGPSTPL